MQDRHFVSPWPHHSPKMNALTNSNVVTLGSLLVQDLPQAYILPERPSTFNHKASFVNSKSYLIHDYSTDMTADHRYLKAMRACAVAGNDLPILLTCAVHPLIIEHWSKWLPFLPRPDIRIFENEDTEKRPLVVNFPFENFPTEKHAVDPDIHYILSSKTRIPEMGAPCPRYMSRDNYTVPCMIKTTQGVGGRGVFLARSHDQALEAFLKLKNNFHCYEPVITEAVENVTDLLNVQLYLFQNGDFHWLGVRRKTAEKSSCQHDLVPDVDWKEQEDLPKLVWDVVKPVMAYLNKHGYFGFTGVEILINNRGKFLIDVNLKTSDSTYLLLLAPHFAANLNFPVSIVAEILPTSIDALLEEIDKLNCEDEGRAILLSGDVTSLTKPIKSCIVVFAKDKHTVFLLHKRLLRSCASLICNGAGDHDENRISKARVLLK